MTQEIYTDLEQNKMKYVTIKCILKPHQLQNGKWNVTFKGANTILDTNQFVFMIREEGISNLSEVFNYVKPSEILEFRVENSNEVGIPIGYMVPVKEQFCHDILQENSKRYQLILKQVIPYIQDLVDLVEGESANSYYSKTKGLTLPVSDAKNIVKLLQNETYGV